jgi:hypothetical protein
MRYRFDAMLYHYGLLWLVNDHYLPEIEAFSGRRDWPPGYLRVIATQHLFLFDDMVFGAASLFDYFAALTGLTLLGVNEQRLKWGSLIRRVVAAERYAEADNAAALLRHGTSALVLRRNREWINQLIEYRSDVIHHRADRPDASITVDLLAENDRARLSVFAPDRFVRRMALRRQKEGDEAKMALLDAAEWLVMRTFDTLTSCFLTLWSDIRDNGHPYEPSGLHHHWFPDTFHGRPQVSPNGITFRLSTEMHEPHPRTERPPAD